MLFYYEDGEDWSDVLGCFLEQVTFIPRSTKHWLHPDMTEFF